MKYFRGDLISNSLTFAISDVVAFALSGLVVKRLSVVRGYQLAFLVASIGGGLYVLLSSIVPTDMIPLIVSLCRMGQKIAFSIGFISVAKLFPTKF